MTIFPNSLSLILLGDGYGFENLRLYSLPYVSLTMGLQLVLGKEYDGKTYLTEKTKQHMGVAGTVILHSLLPFD